MLQIGETYEVLKSYTTSKTEFIEQVHFQAF